MGTMNFLIPENLESRTSLALSRACLAGGYDRTPMPTEVHLDATRLNVRRNLDESAQLLVPWTVAGVGRLMESTATLMERPKPYRLSVELARGKINQIRTHVAEWQMIGFQTTSDFESRLRGAVRTLGLSLMADTSEKVDQLANDALAQAHGAADRLIELYVDQLFAARRSRQPNLTSFLAARTATPPTVLIDPLLPQGFTHLSVPMPWRQIEATETQYNWEDADAAVAWAEGVGMPVIGGPLIDFSPMGLPDWLVGWDGDAASLSSFICDYAETVVARYKGRINRWVVCAAGNNAEVLGLQEDDLLRLTAGLVEAVMQIDSDFEIVVALAQPWGEYLADEDHTYSPFVFADTLLRVGLPIAAFELECLMGVWPRGSYCRDVLEASRLMDLFALLGTPLQVSLGYPSGRGLDPFADPHQELSSAGEWGKGFTPESQADWATRFTALALSKPYVAGVIWHQLSDTVPHLIPHGGLVDSAGQVKPAWQSLRRIREAYLG